MNITGKFNANAAKNKHANARSTKKYPDTPAPNSNPKSTSESKYLSFSNFPSSLSSLGCALSACVAASSALGGRYTPRSRSTSR